MVGASTEVSGGEVVSELRENEQVWSGWYAGGITSREVFIPFMIVRMPGSRQHLIERFMTFLVQLSRFGQRSSPCLDQEQKRYVD